MPARAYPREPPSMVQAGRRAVTDGAPSRKRLIAAPAALSVGVLVLGRPPLKHSPFRLRRPTRRWRRRFVTNETSTAAVLSAGRWHSRPETIQHQRHVIRIAFRGFDPIARRPVAILEKDAYRRAADRELRPVAGTQGGVRAT